MLRGEGQGLRDRYVTFRLLFVKNVTKYFTVGEIDAKILITEANTKPATSHGLFFIHISQLQLNTLLFIIAVSHDMYQGFDPS